MAKISRDEHLRWCKERASEYLEQNNVVNAWNSFLSDMTKHDELRCHIGLGIGQQLFISGRMVDVAKFIQDFR